MHRKDATIMCTIDATQELGERVCMHMYELLQQHGIESHWEFIVNSDESLAKVYIQIGEERYTAKTTITDRRGVDISHDSDPKELFWKLWHPFKSRKNLYSQQVLWLLMDIKNKKISDV